MKSNGQDYKCTSSIVGLLEDAASTVRFFGNPTERGTRTPDTPGAGKWRSARLPQKVMAQPRGKRNQECGFHQHKKEDPRVCNSEY